MAPDAPAPVYDSTGTPVPAWTARAEYSPTSDRVTLSIRTEAGAYSKGNSATFTYGPDEIEQVVADLARFVRVAGARRLF